ncbi:phosphosulfolactate synthase [Domibacillus epiphyticus]|uniref:Phosphosulfolactate synthase n=1 Tax=Domibacillus epiphyticus TaxID=1714355 RepID=A0A1V2A8M3_9BACI|nr:phosphosulfolactate synthase [Domibacillus epiphyticus]OMP67348.1 phosphosulfolactate synthase [Domibacillus epiphyticus]
MIYTGLNLPKRSCKPRMDGITVLIDNGVPLQFFQDTINSSDQYIDFVKFGWGTSVVTKHLEKKIACLQENGVDFFFGGTLFEKFVSQNKVSDFERFIRKFNCRYIEISNGTLEMPNREKAMYIKDFSKDFIVFSEVGAKDSKKSMSQGASEWVEWILEDMESGSEKVITEARESGTSGICLDNGEMRLEIVDKIIEARADLQKIIFEAPTKKMQTVFINLIGSNVNLANISFADPIPLETLRLGLRSDTFYLKQQYEINEEYRMKQEI